jgi:O-antigen ligase
MGDLDPRWEVDRLMATAVATRDPRRIADPVFSQVRLRPAWGIGLLGTIVAVWGYALKVDFEQGIMALGALGLLLAAVGLWVPIVGMLGASMICTLDPMMRALVLTGGFLRWNSFNYLLLVAMVVFWRRMLKWSDLPVRWFAPFILVLMVGLVLSSDPFQGTQHIFGAVSYFGLLLYCERAGASVETWTWSAIVGGVMGAVGGLVFFLQDETIQEAINPNAWAYFPLTALILQCLALSRRGLGERSRTAFLLLAATNAGWIFLSGSRGTSLTALVCLVFCFARSRRLWTLTGFVVTIIVVGTLTADVFQQREERSIYRLTKLFDPAYSLAGRTSGRSDLARAGLHLFLENPLTGVGTGSFSTYWFKLGDIRGLSKYGWGKEAQAHSGWVKTLAESGVPGIVLLVGFVLSFAILGWRQRASGGLSLGLLVTVALSVALLSTEFQNKGLWLMAAAVTLFLRRGRAEAGAGSPPRRHVAPGRVNV